MATKIRLARHGKKGKPFYHVIIADSRSKRDGRYIERIGSYNPNVNPAIIDIDFDKALHWVSVGAQPTDTVRAMLSYKGVLYKNHLLNGVKKGALTEGQAEDKFNTWLAEKDNKIESKKSSLEKAEQKAIADALASEKAKNDARAKLIQETEAAAIIEEASAAIIEEASAATEETPAATEETPAATEETPAATEETPAATEEIPDATKETPAVTEETPAATEETPAATEETPAATEETPAATEEKNKD
jgi:small subunit ribosomal protein S16